MCFCSTVILNATYTVLYLFDQNEKTIVVENMEYLFTTNNEQTEFIKMGRKFNLLEYYFD